MKIVVIIIVIVIYHIVQSYTYLLYRGPSHGQLER